MLVVLLSFKGLLDVLFVFVPHHPSVREIDGISLALLVFVVLCMVVRRTIS
jgi:hypothetical protein